MVPTANSFRARKISGWRKTDLDRRARCPAAASPCALRVACVYVCKREERGGGVLAAALGDE